MEYITQEEWDTAKAKGILEEEDNRSATDWEKTFIKNSDFDSKFGSNMYSKSLKLLRFPTMMEFYGGGIVD